VATRRVTDERLRLSPDLAGAELASPQRRLSAFGIDVAVLLVPSLAVAVAVAWLVLALREPAALAALTDLLLRRATTPEAAQSAVRNLVPLLVEYDMPGVPPEMALAYEEHDLDRAVEALGDRDLVITIQTGRSSPRMPADNVVMVELGRLMPPGVRLASLYGLGAVYFTLLTARRAGATLGKRWLGVKVVRVDGGRPGRLESFERFVGYAQVPASLFTALLDFWRDPNRRLPHDRLSGTLVIRR